MEWPRRRRRCGDGCGTPDQPSTQATSPRPRGVARCAARSPEVAGAGRVAAYVSVGREPGTGPLIEELSDRGVEVLLPLLQNDGDLDWALYEGPRALARVARGLLEPTGEQLGLDAVASCDAVLVPGLAVDRGGGRLGRGGGSYDRALARVGARAFTCVLLHDGEVLDLRFPGCTRRPRRGRCHADCASPPAFSRFCVAILTRRQPARQRMGMANQTRQGHASLYGLFVIIAGVILIAAGVVYLVVSSTLADQHITVADDAARFAGEEVNQPWEAYAQADIIGEHATEIADGRIPPQLPQTTPTGRP